MSRKIMFTTKALNEYIEWQNEDRKTLKKINQLLKDIVRNGYDGLGSPEPLKENLSGYWSREIDSKNRLIYRIENEFIEIIQCTGHYSDK